MSRTIESTIDFGSCKLTLTVGADNKLVARAELAEDCADRMDVSAALGIIAEAINDVSAALGIIAEAINSTVHAQGMNASVRVRPMTREQITRVLLDESLATIDPNDPMADRLAAMMRDLTAAFLAGYEERSARP